MAHDVFINYSPADAPLANAVCAGLEARGLRCWVAARDAPARSDRAGAIASAIRGARVMVLISPPSANSSRQLKRDIARAVASGVSIVTLRADEIPEAGTLDHAAASGHDRDAFSRPVEPQIERLADAIRTLLARPRRQSGSGIFPAASAVPATTATRGNLATVAQFPARPARAPFPARSLDAPPEGGFRQARFGLLVLALISIAYMAVSIGRSRPPHILSVQFPTTIYAGQEASGRIAFEDARKSVTRARFEVIEATSFPAFTVATPNVAGRASGTISFSVNAQVPQHVVLQAVLVDSVGRQSNPMPFAFDVRTPPPSGSQAPRSRREWSIEMPGSSSSKQTR